MKELWQLHFNLLSLEHVILGLLTDGGDLVKLPCHRVRFLQTSWSSEWVSLVVIGFQPSWYTQGGEHAGGGWIGSVWLTLFCVTDKLNVTFHFIKAVRVKSAIFSKMPLAGADLCLLCTPEASLCLFWDIWSVSIEEVKVTHHYLHGTPAGRAPVHRHSLIDHVRHRSHRLCKPSERTRIHNCPIINESFLPRRKITKK